MNPIRARAARFTLAMATVAVLFLQPGCRSAWRLPGQWLALPEAKDGRLDDFSRKMTSHLFANGMMAGLGNDDKYLYVFFTPGLHSDDRPSGAAVLTLWIDERGGKAEKLGLVHVSGPLAPTPPPAAAGERMNDPVAGRQPGSNQQPLLKMVDRRSGKESFITAVGSAAPLVRLTSDWGDFTYLLRIPFSASGDWPGLSVAPGSEIAVGLLWERKMPAGRGKERPDGPRRGGAGRGGPGISPPPGMENNGAPAPAGRRKAWLRTVIASR